MLRIMQKIMVRYYETLAKVDISKEHNAVLPPIYILEGFTAGRVSKNQLGTPIKLKRHSQCRIFHRPDMPFIPLTYFSRVNTLKAIEKDPRTPEEKVARLAALGVKVSLPKKGNPKGPGYILGMMKDEFPGLRI